MTTETKNTMKHCIACELILPELEAQNDRLKLRLQKAEDLIKQLTLGKRETTTEDSSVDHIGEVTGMKEAK